MPGRFWKLNDHKDSLSKLWPKVAQKHSLQSKVCLIYCYLSVLSSLTPILCFQTPQEISSSIINSFNQQFPQVLTASQRSQWEAAFVFFIPSIKQDLYRKNKGGILKHLEVQGYSVPAVAGSNFSPMSTAIPDFFFVCRGMHVDVCKKRPQKLPILLFHITCKLYTFPLTFRNVICIIGFSLSTEYESFLHKTLAPWHKI